MLEQARGAKWPTSASTTYIPINFKVNVLLCNCEFCKYLQYLYIINNLAYATHFLNTLILHPMLHFYNGKPRWQLIIIEKTHVNPK